MISATKYSARTGGSVPTDGRARSGDINYDGDVDVFAVNLVAGLTYNFRMLTHDERSLSDARLTLLNARGNERAEGDDFVSEGEPFISFEARQTGEYWLRARASDDETGAYELRASVGRGSQRGDRLAGGDTDDSINALGGDDHVRGRAGNDTIWVRRERTRWPGATGRTGFGWTGRDTVHGGAGWDRLLGEGGRDSLGGGEDNDELSGGDGNDIA